MKLSVRAGSTSHTFNVFIQDSSSTVGAGLTGLTNATAGLTAYYALRRAAPVQITPLVTLSGPTAAWAAGGFVAIDGVNMPGWYRIDLPDAMFTAGTGRFADLHLKGATNMAPCVMEFELTGWDNQDGVHGGLTALPNAVPAGVGGLPTVDATNSVKVQSNLKKNSALLGFSFVMTDSVTHNPKPAVSPVTVTRKIDSGTHSVGTLSAVTEVGNGEYRVDFGAGDMNGNVITLRATGSGCDDLEANIITVP